MLGSLETGVSARQRIGNKVKMNYAKGHLHSQQRMSLVRWSPKVVKQSHWKAIIQEDYLRTTFRMAIVKDLQVNSADAQVTWAQVFDTTGMQAGVHSELNVDNMGRFIVLEDKMFTLDGQNPQKTVPFMIRGGSMGSIRYNGPTWQAFTDKGLYVVWAAFVMGVLVSATSMVNLASPVGHSRVCFTDE